MVWTEQSFHFPFARFTLHTGYSMITPEPINVEHFNLTEIEREDFEERSAIIEYEGGKTRQQAESYAIKLIMEKRINRPW